MKWIPPLLILFVAFTVSASTYLARRRAGKAKRPLRKDDWAVAWMLGFAVTAVVLFVAALWWYDQPFWLSVLVGLCGAVFGAFWLLMIAPTSSDPKN